MIIKMSSDPQDKFIVYEWWATSPAYVLANLKTQLETAAKIWPQLNQVGLCVIDTKSDQESLRLLLADANLKIDEVKEP